MNNNSFAHINLDYLNMMADGDDSMKKVMLEMLFEELPVEIQKMRSLLNESNWQELGAVSHKMKSTLSFVGNDPLTKANTEIEHIIKSEGNLEDLPELVRTLENMLPQIMEELKGVYSGL